MAGRGMEAVIFRGGELASLDLAVRRIRGAGIVCQVRTASVWMYGLPRTEHEVSVAAVDEQKARRLVADIPQEVAAEGVTRGQRIWIIGSLVVVLVIAVARIVRVLMTR